MSEPFVSRRLDAMPHKTALVVVFVTALIVALCAGTLFAITPSLWTNSAILLGNITHLDHSYAIGVSGFFSGIGPSLLMERSTPMLMLFMASCLIFVGWLMLFLAARSIVQVSWIVIGVFYFLVGTGSETCILCSVTTVSLNAARGNRGTVTGAVVAASGMGALLWAGVESSLFDELQYFSWYFLTLAVASPLLVFVGSFFLRRVGARAAPAAEVHSSPLHSTIDGLADDAFINDDMITRASTPSTGEGSAIESESDRLLSSNGPAVSHTLLPMEQMAQLNSRLSLRFVCVVVSYALIVASSALWLSLQYALADAIDYPIKTTATLPVMWALGSASGALLTGFFGDLAGARMARPWWLAIAGLVSGLCHVACAVRPEPMYTVVQVMQGGALGSAMTTALTVASLEWGLSRIGTTIALMGTPLALFYACAHLVYSFALTPAPHCRGTECFFPMFMGCAGAAAAGMMAAVVVATILQHRATTERYYKA